MTTVTSASDDPAQIANDGVCTPREQQEFEALTEEHADSVRATRFMAALTGFNVGLSVFVPPMGLPGAAAAGFGTGYGAAEAEALQGRLAAHDCNNDR